MGHKQLKLSAVLLLGLGLTGLQAQTNVNATGGNASGNGGSVSYSVGQVVYTTHKGSNGSVAQGVQQPYEISVAGIDEANGISLRVTVYPNPTTDYLTLEIDASASLSIQSVSYQKDASASLSIQSVSYQKDTSTSLSIQSMSYQKDASTSLSIQSMSYQKDASTSLSIQSMSYQLYDIQGKILQNQKITGYRTSIDMNNLVPSTYFVKVIQENKANKAVKTFKVIKY